MSFIINFDYYSSLVKEIMNGGARDLCVVDIAAAFFLCEKNQGFGYLFSLRDHKLYQKKNNII